MEYYSILAICSFLLLVPSNTAAPQFMPYHDVPTFYIGSTTNEITSAIFQNYNYKENDTNVVFSPLGYSVILAVLAEGAQGETREKLLRALELPADLREVREEYKATLQRMTERAALNKPEFKNYFYVYKNYTISESYKELLLEKYLTDVKSADRPHCYSESAVGENADNSNPSTAMANEDGVTEKSVGREVGDFGIISAEKMENIMTERMETAITEKIDAGVTEKLEATEKLGRSENEKQEMLVTEKTEKEVSNTERMEAELMGEMKKLGQTDFGSIDRIDNGISDEVFMEVIGRSEDATEKIGRSVDVTDKMMKGEAITEKVSMKSDGSEMRKLDMFEGEKLDRSDIEQQESTEKLPPITEKSENTDSEKIVTDKLESDVTERAAQLLSIEKDISGGINDSTAAKVRKERIKRLAKKFFGIDLETPKNEISGLSANRLFSKYNAQLSRMIVFNGLYFKAVWKTPFAEKREDDFFYLLDGTQKPVKMIHSKGDYSTGEIKELDSVAIRIPYQGDQYSFLVLLPNERSGLPTLIKKLTSYSLKHIDRQLTTKSVEVSIPSFKFNTISEMKEPLMKRGLDFIFTKDADFSGISPDEGLFVDDLVQFVTIHVDSEPSSLNFLTGSSVGWKNADEKFVADHPFLFFVQDHMHDVTVAAGKVIDPVNSNEYESY